MKPLRLSLALAGLSLAALSLAACAGTASKPTPTPSPTATAQPRPQASATVAPTPASWADAPVTPGDWFLSESGDTVTARFGDRSSEPRFAMACRPATRQITLTRAGSVSAAQPLVIRTETRSISLNAAPLPASEPALAVTLAGSDPLLDAIAFSRGKFAVESRGLSTLVIPPWAEISRVIEACR